MCSSPPHKPTHTPIQSCVLPVLRSILGEVLCSGSRLQRRAVRQPFPSHLKTLLYFTVAGFYLQVKKKPPFSDFIKTQSSSSSFPLGNKRDLCYCSVDCASRRQKGYRQFSGKKNKGRNKDSSFISFFPFFFFINTSLLRRKAEY